MQGWVQGGGCGGLGRVAHLSRVVLHCEARHEAFPLLAARLGHEDADERGVLVLRVHGADEAFVTALGDDDLLRVRGGAGVRGRGWG